MGGHRPLGSVPPEETGTPRLEPAGHTADGALIYRLDICDALSALGIETEPGDVITVRSTGPDAEVDPDMVIIEIGPGS